MVPLIVGGMAAQAAGSIFSGVFGASASKKQAAAIRYAADKASATAIEMDEKARKDVAPFRQMGVEAGKDLGSLLRGDRNMDDVLQSSSLFKFESEIGSRNINRELSARGLHGSGAGLETLARFNNQLVAEEGQRHWERLFNTTQLGANAASHMASNTSATGRSVSNMQAQTGMNAAGAEGDALRSIGSIGSGIAGAVGSGINTYAQYKMYEPLLTRMGGGGGGRQFDPLYDASDSSSLATFG